MAKLIDKEPKYEGEIKTWNAFGLNLPTNWVIYNTRSVNGREYDFCIMAPEVGLFIVEVKGWYPTNILTVVDQNTIIIEGMENPEDSLRSQARGYRFDLLKKIQKELGMNPLVMSLVCYPYISREQYLEKGLNVVSEENETIFEEDLINTSDLYQKLMNRYNVDKGAKHDELSSKRFALIRHHFEPNYDLKNDEKILNPGYSRLRAFRHELTEDEINKIVDEYFNGIKEIAFVPSESSMNLLINALQKRFELRNIYPSKANLAIGKSTDLINVSGFHFNVFNFEIEVITDIYNIINQDFLVEEGKFDEVTKDILIKMSTISEFNFQQYEIEHAPCDKNILITAGAGTGKTFSMVSRIAYLCNKTADSVVDIVGDIAMITFTNDAADNMKIRLKKMFMNYFILTSNEKYMHLIEDMSQIQISTIHKFAISLLQRDCMRLGLGYDSNVSRETYNRKELYHYHLNRYLSAKSEENPDFAQQLALPTYRLEELLISFCDKLYDRSIDVKKLSSNCFGDPTSILPFFNELVDEVIIKAEKDYELSLKSSNLIGLRECMIQINELVKNRKLMKQGHEYKYVFVDEFQDTDDVQIDTVIGLQHLFGEQCRLFIVGDLKQSIYRFRGASLSAFDKAVSTDGEEAWEFYSLNRNYRTDGRLLDKFHSIFSQMGMRNVLPYNESKDRLESHIAKEYPDEMLINKIDTHQRDKDTFYHDLFEEINNQVRELKELSESEKLSSEEKTIAILVRYNWQIKDIVKEADKKGILVKVTEGGDLYRLPSTRDLYKLVMAITHPRNETYLTNLIMSNYVSLSVKMIDIAGKTRDEKRTELIRLLDEYFMLFMGKSWDQLILGFATRPVLVVLRDIYEAVKPWSHFKDKDAQTAYRQNYECLMEKLTAKYAREYLTINKIAEFLKINITTFQEESSRSSVNTSEDVQIICTTIHKSKGLEYGTVILPFTNEDLSNINVGSLNVNYVDGKVSYGVTIKNVGTEHNNDFDESLEIREKIQEESRVLYVALTRAIRNLVWLKDLDTDVEDCWANYLEVIE